MSTEAGEFVAILVALIATISVSTRGLIRLEQEVLQHPQRSSPAGQILGASHDSKVDHEHATEHRSRAKSFPTF
jgi:hypothetical protein